MPMMTAEQAAEQGKTLTFEKVWAALMENREQFKETDKQIRETDKRLDKRFMETEKNMIQLEKTVDRLSKNIGGLNRSMGELVETLIAARLWEKFPQYGLKRAYQRVPLYDEKNQIKTDIDILLVNTVMCMAVEVKHELNRMDEVDGHLKRMKLIRQYPPPLITADKELVGAMAGGNVNPEVKEYAYKSGFYVLELTGESVQLVTPPEGFEPKKW